MPCREKYEYKLHYSGLFKEDRVPDPPPNCRDSAAYIVDNERNYFYQHGGDVAQYANDKYDGIADEHRKIFLDFPAFQHLLRIWHADDARYFVRPGRKVQARVPQTITGGAGAAEHVQHR